MKNVWKILLLVLILGMAVAACIPSEGDVTDIVSTVAGQITYVPVTFTPDLNTIVAQTFAAMTVQTGGQPAPATGTALPPQTPQELPGSISGALSYPSEMIPPLRVVAYNIFDQSYRYVDTMPNQSAYQIDGLTPGKYHVVAYTTGAEGFPAGLAGGYTQMVVCGLTVTCTDHTLIDVPVFAGRDTPNINPADWYADPSAFPPIPNQGLSLPAGTDDGPPALSGNGGIAGKIGYPAGAIPVMRIVAFRVDNLDEYYSVVTQEGQGSYSLAVPPGTYYVVAYTLGGDSFPEGLAGGYTQAVVCGMKETCTDHTLVKVPASSMVVLNSEANIYDWPLSAESIPENPYP